METIQAIHNYCTVEMLKVEELKQDLIYIPATLQKTPRWGKVLTVGEGVPDLGGRIQKPGVNSGDTVYVASHGQFEIYKNSNAEYDNLIVTSVHDMLAILKDKDTLTMEPLGNLIEIEKIEMSDTNEFGVALPDAKKAPTNRAIVKKLGQGFRSPDGNMIPFQVAEGDEIIYSPLRTIVIDFSDLGISKQKFLISHNDIIGRVVKS